jgi:hypothetical protein
MLDALKRARTAMAGQHVPVAADLDALALEAAAARDSLARSDLASDAAGITELERAELAHLAVMVKLEMGKVGRLAAGGARYAAIVKSLGEVPVAGLYGRGGVKPGEPGPGLERKV